MNPRSDVPRSVFPVTHRNTVPFNFSELVPIFNEEVLPGDTWNVGITIAARTAVPLVPVQDNWKLEFFAFFTPMRLTWVESRRFWGEQDTPSDSINYTIPQGQCSQNGGYAVGSLMDYLGLPTVGQYGAGNPLSHNALPVRAYFRTWNEWFRDENLQASDTYGTAVDNGPSIYG